MDNSNDMQRLLARLRAGDPDATAEFFRRYGRVIQVVVRRHLHHRLRPRFDSLDFVQDVWVSFLALPAERYTFTSPQQLVGFLTRVAQNKLIEVFRQHFQTQKHDIRRELSLGSERTPEEPSAPVASPSAWAIAGERWEWLLSHLPPGHRVIVERLREGHNYEDIAKLTKVSVSTVNRIVRRLKELTGP